MHGQLAPFNGEYSSGNGEAVIIGRIIIREAPGYRCLPELVEKVAKRDYRGYERVGYPLPTAVVLGKFD
ncbi:hypothetical protein Elgi_64900 [Paenibacillus elgii]|nr:hypothetical protein Elgi_64900 [Paenibacillus elgii]